MPPSSVAQSQLPPPPGPGYQTQPPEPSLPRRHRVGVRGQARPRRRWVLAVAGPLVLVVLVGAGAYFGRSWLAAGGTGCAGGKVMRLAVAPEIQPLVDRAAAGTGDRCVTVKTTVLNPGQTASSLAGGDFDGWIPASSAWLGLQSESSGTGGATAQPTATGTPGSGGSGFAPASLVRTPLVVAAPYPLAQQLGWPKQEPTWAVLAGAVIAGKIPRFSMDSPVRTATGLLGVLAVQAAMNRTTPDQGIAQLRALTLRSRLTDAEADAPTLLQKLGGLSDPVAAVRDVGAFPVTEQALRTYEQGQPAVPLAAMYPADGLMEADYPLALTPSAAADSDRRDMANRIVARFRSADFAPTVTSFGFRSAAPQAQGAPPPSAPAGQPGDGLLAQYPTTTPVPTNPVLVNQLADQWARYQRINFNVLVLIDGSASMDEQVRDRSGHLTTKAGLLRVAGAQAAQLFGLDTSLALWVFATQTPTSPPYTVAIPFGPLDQPLAGPGSPTRRAALAKAVSTFQPFVPGATPLYESVLRGVTTMQPLVRPGSLTLVVVLTDGRDEQSPYAMSRQQFLTRLNAIRDPQRPVPVFAIGYGTDADMGALNSMAQATGGRAVASNDPGDLASAVAQIFLAAHNAR
ncbi:MAG: hypothetical protein J2P15_21290 [Micromonosporaceae bacterium]|nr:hypothetical protein [Micromonosporaceae bacterium]